MNKQERINELQRIAHEKVMACITCHDGPKRAGELLAEAQKAQAELKAARKKFGIPRPKPEAGVQWVG